MTTVVVVSGDFAGRVGVVKKRHTLSPPQGGGGQDNGCVDSSDVEGGGQHPQKAVVAVVVVQLFDDLSIHTLEEGWVHPLALPPKINSTLRARMLHGAPPSPPPRRAVSLRTPQPPATPPQQQQGTSSPPPPIITPSHHQDQQQRQQRYYAVIAGLHAGSLVVVQKRSSSLTDGKQEAIVRVESKGDPSDAVGVGDRTVIPLSHLQRLTTPLPSTKTPLGVSSSPSLKAQRVDGHTPARRGVAGGSTKASEAVTLEVLNGGKKIRVRPSGRISGEITLHFDGLWRVTAKGACGSDLHVGELHTCSVIHGVHGSPRA